MSNILDPEQLEEIYGDVDHEEVQEQLGDLLDLHRKRAESAGARVMNLERDLRRVHYIVNANYRDLINAIDWFHTEEDLISRERIEDLDEGIMEITRHLHNYVGSTVARYDHTEKRAISKLDSLCDCSPGIKDAYTEKKQEELGNQPAFFTGLRNYSYHRRLPVPAGRERGPATGPVTRELYLSKEILLEGEWSNAAREYLDGLDEEIDLVDELENYHSSLDEMQDWLFDKIAKCCENELEAHDEIVREIRAKQKQLLYR